MENNDMRHNYNIQVFFFTRQRRVYQLVFTYLIFAYSESKLRSYFVLVVVSNGKVYFIKMMFKNPSKFFKNFSSLHLKWIHLF